MGNHVSTDSVPFTLEDIAYTQQELSKHLSSGASHLPIPSPRAPTPRSADGYSATALPGEVVDRFDGIDHNVKAFRLLYRPTASGSNSGGGGGTSSGAPGSGNPSPPSPANSGQGHKDPHVLTSAPPVLPGTRRGSAPASYGNTGSASGGFSGGDRRRSTPRGGYAAAVAGGGTGNDPIVSSHVRIEPLSLHTAHVKVRPSEVYLILHIQRLPMPGAGPSPASLGEDLTPRVAAAVHACGMPFLGGRQWAEDTEVYGADRTPPWATQLVDLVTPRGLSVAFASDIGKPAVSSHAVSLSASHAASSPMSRSPRSAPPTGDRAGEFQYSIHLLTGKRAHPLTAAVAVLHALQVERRFAECPELVRRLFFNCNLARVPLGGNPTSSVVGIERNRVNNMLVVTKPVPVGQLVVDGADSNGGSARSQSGAAPNAGQAAGTGSSGGVGGTGPAPAVSFASPPLVEMYSKNALLRFFHSARLPGMTPRLSPGGASSPTSARYSYSSTPRSGPGGSIGAMSTTMNSAYGHKAPTPTSAITSTREPQLQGPPALEIPKLRNSIMTPGRTTATPGSSGTPRAPRLRGASTGAAAGSRGPREDLVGLHQRGAGTATTLKSPPPASRVAGHGDANQSRANARRASNDAAAAEPASGCVSPPPPSSLDGTHPHTDSDAADSVSTHGAPNGSSPAGGLPVLSDLRLDEVLSRSRVNKVGGLGPTPRRQTPATAANKHPTRPHQATAVAPAAHSNGVVAPLPLMNLTKGAASSESDRSNGSAGDSEANEQRMSEDRVQRLRQAAPEATEVLPWLFVGGEAAAKDRQQLLEKGITAVVNTVAFDLPNYHNDVFRYLPLNVCDAPDEPIFSLFPVVNRFVDQEKEDRHGKVFIHCHQGVSRSCSFVIAYVMWKQGLCYDRAYELVRTARKVCSPNTGFYVNLHLWEDQLVKPVFNKAFAYVPYSPEYAFPFSFRLALTFRKNAALTHDDDDTGIVTPYTQVIEEGGSGLMDERAFYGFLFGERAASANTKGVPLNSFSFCGPRCDPVIRERASQEWLSFLHYSFYQGPRRTSVNDKAESLSFVPLAALDAASHASNGTLGVPAATEPAEVVMRVRRLMFAASARRLPFTLTVGVFTKFDPLFQHTDLVFRFVTQLEEEGGTKTEEENRKRAREEEVRRGGGGGAVGGQGTGSSGRHHPYPYSAHPHHIGGRPTGRSTTSDGSRTAKSMGSSSSNGAATQQALLPVQSSPHKTATPPVMPQKGAPSPRSQIFSAGDVRRPGSSPALSSGASNPRAPTAPFLSLKLPGATTRIAATTGQQQQQQPPSQPPNAPYPHARRVPEDALLPPITDVVVLPFPFNAGVLRGADDDGAIILLDDLEPTECYAVVVPDTGAGNMGNRVFLWVGSESGLDSSAVWEAFYANMAERDGDANEEEDDDDVSPCVVRVPGHSPLWDTTPELVYSGEEPDELLLVM